MKSKYIVLLMKRSKSKELEDILDKLGMQTIRELNIDQAN